MEKSLCKQLAAIVGQEHCLTSPEELACYSYDASGQAFMPEVVLFPDRATQVAAILRLANQHRFPVVARGAGSGMTGGSLPVRGGVVLACSRMNRIVEIDADNMLCVVEPGVITGELQEAVRHHGLMYAPDPASLKFCTIGGNVAECAGGPSAVKYGVTRDSLLGLEVVLPTGEIMRTGVRTEKGVTGYDLTHLFAGSEGTLGIFTRLILRLLPAPEARTTFLLTLDSLSRATGLVAEIIQSGLSPCTLEYMDKTAISVVADRISLPLPKSTEALLLVELDGSKTEVSDQSRRLLRFLADRKISYRQATDDDEIRELWQARRAISPATFAIRPHKISEDVVVPRSRIPELVRFTTELSQRLELTILTFGHAGDGNIHVNIMLDKTDQAELERALKAREELFTRVLKLQGTLSGEHGIGITKSSFLAQELDPTALALMQKIKNLFDPNDILNPGKIFPRQELQTGDD
ncbi:FAD-binding protein [Desulfolithobacter dissulfuricans]|uniref:FAD-binding protein n=1 Tax=Desulfolithobacter dissulfuricans TaxID=2795293 RepID=A0A915TXW1_9BACT|nr:FAD-linked oxidase C-terminal domain-containing protein [Desulfolithobacter dissulfuricans]BCO07784.1 FAD-binding protein [Desulfolithobacter dissulfuricans]